MRIVRVAGFNGLLRDEITLPLLCDLRQRSKLVNLSLFRQGTHAQGNAGDAGRIEAGLGGTSATRRFTNGMDLRCPRCRMRHWIGIDALRHAGMCPGCGSSMSVAPETSWSYDLNPLVRHCVNSRALAVWQALAEVARGLGSFFFTPSTKLYLAQAINGAAKKEVDVLCVSEGIVPLRRTRFE